MTMDIHLQITLPDDCITPNVPRIKASFFNRKFRDIQATPTTPKITNARIKVTSSGRGRPKRSATGSAGSGRSKPYSPHAARPSKGRSSIDEAFDKDFSTPKATRHLLTPPSTSFAKSTKNGRVTHLIYRPLELDNESSSESMDARRKRKRLEELSSSESRSPLAIEAPRPPQEESLSQLIDFQQQNYQESKQDQTILASKTKIDSDQNKHQEVKLKDEVESQDGVTHHQFEAKSKLKSACDKSASAEKMAESEEPEIIEVEPDLPDSPSFVPGNCNIEDIFKLFGKPSHQISTSQSN